MPLSWPDLRGRGPTIELCRRDGEETDHRGRETWMLIWSATGRTDESQQEEKHE